MPPFKPPPSNFLFQESLPPTRQDPFRLATGPLGHTEPYYPPSDTTSEHVQPSDYYRARHNLGLLWQKVGPTYFPGRQMPTLDPQIWGNQPDPYDKTQLGSGWGGLTWPRSLNIPATQYRSNEALPYSATYSLDALTLNRMADPYAKPNDFAELLGNAGRTAIHEWAHNFQNPITLGDKALTEGGAEAFSRAVSPYAISSTFGSDPHSKPWNYPAWTREVQSAPNAWDWISRKQFELPANFRPGQFGGGGNFR